MKTMPSLRLPMPGSVGQSGRTKTALTILKILGLLVLLIIALIFPSQIASDDATNSIAIYTLMFAGFVTAWNIFQGIPAISLLGTRRSLAWGPTRWQIWISIGISGAPIFLSCF